jgi:glycosyltransferase involved in cell wall biosynthesis
VVDGESTDGTDSLVAPLMHKINFKFYSEQDSGIYDAMNKGLELSNGEIIGFLNADDYYANSDVLLKISKVFEDTSVEACFGDLVYVTKDKLKNVRFWKSSSFNEGSFSKAWCPAHPTFYVRRSLYEKLGGFDLNYKFAADVEFMIRYFVIGNINAIYIPAVLVIMRLGGITNKNWKNIFLQNREIFHAMRKYNLHFSRLIFLIYKILNRLQQRLFFMYK